MSSWPLTNGSKSWYGGPDNYHRHSCLITTQAFRAGAYTEYNRTMIVTLDGPAGAGKSTVARSLAAD